MSAPVARTSRGSTSAGTTHTTRQQLDELDALLQRMLDLPVNPTEQPPAPAERPARMEEHPVPVRSRPAMRSVPQEPAPAAPRVYQEEPDYPEPQAPVLPPRREIPPAPRAIPPGAPPTPPAVPLRGYPASYMVVETSTPTFLGRGEGRGEVRSEGRGEQQHPTDAGLGPRVVSHAIPPSYPLPPEPAPVPGGRHDLVEDQSEEQAQLAALRARIEEQQQRQDWVPFKSSWQPSAQTWKPLAQSWEQQAGPPEDEPAPPESVPQQYTPQQQVPSQVPHHQTPPHHAHQPYPPQQYVPQQHTPQHYAPREQPHPAVVQPEPPMIPPIPRQGTEVHRTPASMDMPWTLNQPQVPVHRPAPVMQPNFPMPGQAAPVAIHQPPLPQQPMAAPDKALPPPPAAQPSVLLWPLIAFNALFDVPLYLLGPIGSWLRGPAGGSVLATLGFLGLVAAAVLVAAEGFGWTR